MTEASADWLMLRNECDMPQQELVVHSMLLAKINPVLQDVVQFATLNQFNYVIRTMIDDNMII